MVGGTTSPGPPAAGAHDAHRGFGAPRAKYAGTAPPRGVGMRRLMLIIAVTVVCLAAATAALLARSPRPGQTVALQRAAVAASDVQRNYDQRTGLFCPRSGNCWWWTANLLTALADYGRRAHTRAYLGDLATSYRLARYQGPDRAGVGPFLDTWNDDDGWWGLAWLEAYRYARPYAAAQADSYLELSGNIFAYLARQWVGGSCGGGLWQNEKPGHLKDAITNELFLSLAGQLYQTTGDPGYLNWASREWNWFHGAGFIGPHQLVHDHLTAACAPAGAQYWTYNQGVILGGLTTLSEATRAKQPALARTYLQQAEAIADCVTSRSCGGNPTVARPTLLDAHGVLSEPCETRPCTYAPAYAYKGIFVRNLARLNGGTGRYSAFLAANAASLWQSGRNAGNLFGFYWDQPPAFYLPAGGEAPVEGAALDLFTAQLRAGG